MRRIIVFCFALILFVAPFGSFAQQDSKPAEKPTHYYRLSYSVQEVGEAGKVINSRTYETSIATGNGPPAQMRTGDKVPVLTDSKEGNVQYIDVGVSIDCTHALEVDGKLSVQMTADISTNTTKGTNPSAMPLIRANRWSANVLVPIAKPTIVFSSDNLQDKGKLQVELTATRID
jgi:hypothetical protein